MPARETLLQLALLYEGDTRKIIGAIQQNKFPETEIEYKGDYITILDEVYPEVLKKSYMPPLVLFYEGDISLLQDKSPKIAVATSRHNDEEQKKLVKKLLVDTDYTLILGGRSETDKVIAQETDNPLIVVSGTPLSMVDEKFKKEKNLILTEYPEKTNVEMSNFPRRNQIIGGLCDKVLVLWCQKKSGTNVLIMSALTNGKDIMVVPTSPFVSEEVANNEFIYDGAIPVWTKQKLCETMGID